MPHRRAALAQALAQATAERPLTAPVPPRVDEVQATTRRLSGVSVGVSTSADVEPTDDSLRVVLPPKPPLPTLVDLEAAGDVLWRILILTECTAGVRKLNSDGTPKRVGPGGNSDYKRKEACASHLAVVASMVVHAGGLASLEGWKSKDLRSKDVDALLNDAHTLAKTFNELDVELRAPGALKSKTALGRENEAQRAAEIDQEVKE